MCNSLPTTRADEALTEIATKSSSLKNVSNILNTTRFWMWRYDFEIACLSDTNLESLALSSEWHESDILLSSISILVGFEMGVNQTSTPNEYVNSSWVDLSNSLKSMRSKCSSRCGSCRKVLDPCIPSENVLYMYGVYSHPYSKQTLIRSICQDAAPLLFSQSTVDDSLVYAWASQYSAPWLRIFKYYIVRTGSFMSQIRNWFRRKYANADRN